MTRMQTVAHRGYSAQFPENTVAGAEAAIAAGADLIEADVRLSASGTLFCFHDPDLSRLTGQRIIVAETHDEGLRAARHDGGISARFSEILTAVSGRAGLLVDTKLEGEAVLRALYAELADAHWPDRIWLGLRFPNQVAQARAMFGRRVLLLGLMPRLEDAEDFLAAGADALRVWEAELALPQAMALKAKAPIWVTAGHTRGLAVGDTDAQGIAALHAFSPAAVLLNDPTLLGAAP